MGKRAAAIATGIILAAFLLAGCGLIGGPFTEPSPDEAKPTETAAATPGSEQTALPAGQGTETSPVSAAQLPQDCENVLDLVRSELGETKCVGGIVYREWQDHGTFYIDFSTKSSSFFMIGQNWQSPFVVHPGDCVYAQGKIVETERVLSMGIDPHTLKECPGSADQATASP